MITRLTRRQRRVMVLVAMGLTNRQIAEVLHIADRTVQTHLSAAFNRLGVDNRVTALVVLGWICIPEKYME